MAEHKILHHLRAIKVLPRSRVTDKSYLDRFYREGRAAAALNHPHIAAIYGFEKSPGMHALVMELVEGDDLSQRIARGAIPLDDALPIAKQRAHPVDFAPGATSAPTAPGLGTRCCCRRCGRRGGRAVALVAGADGDEGGELDAGDDDAAGMARPGRHGVPRRRGRVQAVRPRGPRRRPRGRGCRRGRSAARR